MSPIQILYKLSGYASIGVGLVATLCISRIEWMYYGIALSILGFIFSGINIFLNVKYYSEDEGYSKGYIGMFLSSLPVIFLMLIIFKFRPKA
jgi:hypothetical protein